MIDEARRGAPGYGWLAPRSSRLKSAHAENFLYDRGMMVPPLNQTLWTLLVVSLTIGAAWLGLLLTAEQNGFWDKRSDDRSRPPRP